MSENSDREKFRQAAIEEGGMPASSGVRFRRLLWDGAVHCGGPYVSREVYEFVRKERDALLADDMRIDQFVAEVDKAKTLATKYFDEMQSRDKQIAELQAKCASEKQRADVLQMKRRELECDLAMLNECIADLKAIIEKEQQAIDSDWWSKLCRWFGGKRGE